MRPGAPKPSRWTLRRGFVVRALVVTVVAVGAAMWWMLAMPGTSWRGAAPPPTAEEGKLQVAIDADVRHLSAEIGDRSIYRPLALEAAAKRIEERFRAAGLTPRRETYEGPEGPMSNVIAEVAGGARADEIVVVGAHYDTVRGSPGANDNATGVAALVALAERLAGSRPAATLRFVAFTGEEPPCFQTDTMGSRVHARGCRARGERVTAMLALETLGCYSDAPGTQEYPIAGMGLLYPTRGNFVAFTGGTASRGLVRRAIATFRRHGRVPSEGAALPLSVPGVGWSDHWAFAQEGFDAAMVTDTAVFRDRAYHSIRDVPDNVDFRTLTLVVVGLDAVVRDLAGR